MTRTRAVVVGATVVCVLIVGVIAVSSGGNDGPRTFVARDAESVLLVHWMRVGTDVSGSLTLAHLVRPTPGIFDTRTTTDQAPRDVRRDHSAFTGTINDNSVRLRLTDGAFGPRLNGRLDGDTLELVIPQARAQQTLTLKNATRETFDAAVGELRTAEAHRVSGIRATRERADAAARTAITRVATAYMKALDPRSSDDPCRYVTATAKVELLRHAPSTLRVGGCRGVVRFREREQQGGAPPRQLGAATIELRQPIPVASESSGRLADGAELRFRGIPNHPIGVIREHGQWRIAAPAGTA